MAPRQIHLRVDAQVMLIKNVDETLVNGSMGRILRFVDPAIYGTEQDREQSGEGGVVGATSTNPDAVAKKNHSNSAGLGVKMYPVVEFVMPTGARRRVLVMPEIWKLELPNGEVQVSRTQVRIVRSVLFV
jgi:ATP-dependent DNA helicase PIF1